MRAERNSTRTCKDWICGIQFANQGRIASREQGFKLRKGIHSTEGINFRKEINLRNKFKNREKFEERIKFEGRDKSEGRIEIFDWGFCINRKKGTGITDFKDGDDHNFDKTFYILLDFRML